MIRKLTENDFGEAVSVICRSFMTVAEEFDITGENAPAFTAFATDENKLRTWMFDQHRPMYGFFDDGKMVGYYNLMIKDKECELGSLSVLPEYRHKKIGRTLLEDSLSKASGAGCTIMKLSIVEENKVLRKWYEDQGFIHTGTVKYDFFPFTCGYLEKKLEIDDDQEAVYLSEFCDVFYVAAKNVVLVHWKKYCELEDYRTPLECALKVISGHPGCNYVADTRDGFEDNPLDTRWVAEYFMPKAKECGCRIIYFVIDEDNSLRGELEGQEKDSSELLEFRYIYGMDEIGLRH